MNRRIAVCALAAALAGLTACGPKAETPNPDVPAKKVVGATLLTKTHVFFQDLSAAMEEAAAEKNIDLRIQFCDFDGAKQNDQMDTFMRQKVDAIIVAPQDSQSIAPAINEARGRGIPVFTVDIAAHNADVVCHVASDNYLGGKKIAEYLAKLLDGKGKVGVIDHPAVASVQDRTRGFKEVMAQYPEIEIVAFIPGEGQRQKANSAARDLLQAHPDINGIFGINDDSALGALAAVEAAGLQDKVVIVGFDGTPEARETIRRGTALKADAVQYPEQIGATVMDVIAKHFAGEEVPPVIEVEVGIIDAESLKSEQGS